MKFERIRVYNFENALYGMRNPKNSWDKSDSSYGFTLGYPALETFHNMYKDAYGEEPDNYLDYMKQNVFLHTDDNGISEYALIGPKDMKLAQTLIKSGPEHRKFMRQIFVTVDITAPLYWWKEFDTYKVGTVANSTSTMHKLTSKPITLDCFEIDDYNGDLKVYDGEPYTQDDSLNDCIESVIDMCETLRQRYLETKDKKYWKELVRWLPESWLQTRTVTMNYENLLAICSKSQRRFHKLTEWSGDGEDFVTPSFIKFARSLPYAAQFIFIDEQTDDNESSN